MTYPRSEVPTDKEGGMWPQGKGGAGLDDGAWNPVGHKPGQDPYGSSAMSGADGEETYEDGSSYVGQLSDGRRHGRGVWKSETEQYSGQWSNDQRDGQGQQTWQDGRTYDGQFKEGKFHGHGRMEWHMQNGLMVYEGEYMDDLKHGNGRYVWPDNRVYDGQWKRGQRWGRATYTNAVGQNRVGIWKEDKVERWLEDGAEGNNPEHPSS